MFIKLAMSKNHELWLHDSNFDIRIDSYNGISHRIMEICNQYKISALPALKAWVCQNDLRTVHITRKLKLQNILKISIRNYPEFQFKEKYYHCLMNHIKKLEFLGK